MSQPGAPAEPDDFLVDLLVKQVTEGLSPAEQRELDALDSPGTGDTRRDLERAAAAVSLAGLQGALQAPPDALRQRLRQQAESHFGSAPISPAAAAVQELRRAPARGAWGAMGWLAAAACLLLALVGWLRPPPAAPIVDLQPTSPPAAATPPAAVPEPAKPPSPAELRAALLATPNVLKITLGATKDPAAKGASGDVVWDPATQQGYIRLVGLAPNDPRAHQFQIWIFDAERDKRYPVAGGVFDASADGGELVIPIHAELAVHRPAAFAVTLEKAGGVVVSTRDHVIALGAAS